MAPPAAHAWQTNAWPRAAASPQWLRQVAGQQGCAVACRVQVMDANKDGYISFDEFAKWWATRKQRTPVSA